MSWFEFLCAQYGSRCGGTSEDEDRNWQDAFLLENLKTMNTGYPTMRKLALCKSALTTGVAVRLRVTGISMVPALWPGDWITLRQVPFGDLRLGDVVAFARDDCVIVHRIVGQTRDRSSIVSVTRGDGQQHEDLPLLPAELLGVVTSFRRFGADRLIGSQPSRVARAIAQAVGRSGLARFLLLRIYSRLIEWIPAGRVSHVNPRLSPWRNRMRRVLHRAGLADPVEN